MESLPEEISYIRPYLTRSEEMKVADPIISYYTLRYALQQALDVHKQNPNNKEVKQYMMSMMGIMEEKRKSLGEVAEPKAHFERFITMLFVSCDNDDRKIGSTKATAQKFLVLSYFIEAMGVFEELPPDWVEKRKYCKWKAADILKALKRGEQPLPGGPSERDGNGNVEEKKEEEKASRLPESSAPAPFVPPPRPQYDAVPRSEPPPPVVPQVRPQPDAVPRSEPPPESQYKYNPPPEAARKAPVTANPAPPRVDAKESTDKRVTVSRGAVLSKEHRAAIDLAKKMAMNGVQELEYKNIQQARVAFENAIRALDAFNS